MLDFIKRQRRLIVLVILLLMSLQSLSSGIRPDARMNLPSRMVLSISYYPLNFINSAFLGARRVWFGYIYLVNLRIENEELRGRIAQLEGEKGQLLASLLENERLRGLLNFKEAASVQGIIAEIIGVETSGEFKTILLNKGSSDGVRGNMQVVTSQGVVGRIFQLSGKTSRVLLIIDHNSSIEVMIQRTRVRAILEGLSKIDCNMRYLPRLADVKVGDTVITSGFGGFFQKGLPVGVVTKIEKKNYGIYQDVLVRPYIDFTRFEEALILPNVEKE